MALLYQPQVSDLNQSVVLLVFRRPVPVPLEAHTLWQLAALADPKSQQDILNKIFRVSSPSCLV
jgi:hypothetical protein